MCCTTGNVKHTPLKIAASLLIFLLVQDLPRSLETADIHSGSDAATADDETEKSAHHHHHRVAVHLTPAPTRGQSTMLLLTNVADKEVLVEVKGQAVQRNVTVQANNYRAVTLQRPTTHSHGTGTCSGETSYLTSRHPIIVSTINLGSCASFLTLPLTALGTLYEIITWSPTTSAGQSSISIVAGNDDVIVEISLPANRQCEVFSRGLRFFCGDVFLVDVLRSESVSLLSSSDLSGTVINSTGRISVFAGNYAITVGPGNVTDQMTEELLPVSGWQVDGATPTLAYAIPSIPDNNHSGYSVKVTTGGVKATIAVASKVYEVTGGQVLTLDFVDNAPVLIQADVPLQVVQFVRGATDPADSGAPAAQVIPELRQYASSYAYTNPTGYTHYVIVVIERNASQTGLVVDNAPVDVTGWTAIGGTTLVTKGIRLSVDGYSVIYHRSQVPFGAFRYSYVRGNCAYAYPAGIVMATQQNKSSSLDPTRVVTEPWSPMSGVSSAPMSIVQERSTGLSPQPAMTSPEVTTQSTATEPPADIDCELSNMGTEFIVSFMENRDSTDTDLSLYPVTFSASTDINVKVEVRMNTSDDDVIQSFPLRTGERVVARIPPEVEMVGVEGSSSKAVKVTSNRKLSLFGMNSVTGSCDGFLALPVSALGTDYYTVSFFPPDHKTQISLVALYNDTQVNVTLRLPTRPGIYIKWNGVDYTNSLNRNMIPIVMNELDAVQLQDNSDLTGTRVTSNRPLGVFTGNDYSRVGSSTSPMNGLLASHLVEQIPPVSAWGRQFHVVPLPETDAGYALKVVASLSNTTVTLSNVSTEWQLQVMVNPGDFRTIYFTNRQFVTVRTTKPVLLAQLAESSFTSSPTMMVIPPVEQYKSSYSFTTGENSSTEHFLLLVVDLLAVPRLQLDGELVNQTGWTQISNNSRHWGNYIRVTSGVHVVTQLDGIPFAAYLYGQSVFGCAYAFPAGLCLQPVQDAKSTSAIPSTTSFVTTSTATQPPSHKDFIDDCSCLRITSSLQPTYNGVYLVQADLYNGLPVFQRLNDCPLFLYRFQQEAAYWIIGPTLGMSTGAIQSAWNDSSLPYDVTRWSAFSAENSSFVDDKQLTVECSCPALSVCRSVEFINITTGSSILQGVFFQQPTTSGGRPVYKHDQIDLYLYYRSGNGICSGYWTVSSDSVEERTGGRSLMMLEANATDPLQVVSADYWDVYDSRTGTFHRDAKLRLVCYNDSTVVS